jgi:CheY-like chemotaxis protein
VIRRALVVSEQAGRCELVSELSKAENMDIVAMANTAEAEGKVQDGKFDVIFLELARSSSDGVELVKKIRSSGFNRSTPIVVLSDIQRPGTLGKAFAAGANFFVCTPVDRACVWKLMRIAQVAIEHERRRFRRVATRVRVQVKCAEVLVEGETVDLSLSGTLIRASRVFPAGSSVELRFLLPSGREPLIGHGRVARASGDTMGILIDNLPFKESERLQEYLLPLLTAEATERRELAHV